MLKKVIWIEYHHDIEKKLHIYLNLNHKKVEIFLSSNCWSSVPNCSRLIFKSSSADELRSIIEQYTKFKCINVGRLVKTFEPSFGRLLPLRLSYSKFERPLNAPGSMLIGHFEFSIVNFIKLSKPTNVSFWSDSILLDDKSNCVRFLSWLNRPCWSCLTLDPFIVKYFKNIYCHLNILHTVNLNIPESSPTNASSSSFSIELHNIFKTTKLFAPMNTFWSRVLVFYNTSVCKLAKYLYIAESNVSLRKWSKRRCWSWLRLLKFSSWLIINGKSSSSPSLARVSDLIVYLLSIFRLFDVLQIYL